MTFEEFFKKKKISLVALEQGEPVLFSEFKVHFEKMGEKSFDHTKKYWFNKLRLRFPAQPEPKVENVVMENPLAEQTVIETLSEKPDASPVNVGFKPRFKAGMTKPAESTPDTVPKAETEKPTQSNVAAAPTPAVGFKPRFKAGVTKSVEPVQNAEPEKPKEDVGQSTPPPALGFKPKFKAGVTKTVSPAPEQKEKTTEEQTPAPELPVEDSEAKPAYKPRFNMKNIKPKEPGE